MPRPGNIAPVGPPGGLFRPLSPPRPPETCIGRDPLGARAPPDASMDAAVTVRAHEHQILRPRLRAPARCPADTVVHIDARLSPSNVL